MNGAPRRDGPRPERHAARLGPGRSPRRWRSSPSSSRRVSSLAREAVAQAGVFREERLAGLQWTFVRVKYTPTTGDLAMRTRFGFWDDPWAIDAPAAEQNLSRRAADGHGDRGRRAAGDGARRSAALAVSRGSTWSSRATWC